MQNYFSGMKGLPVRQQQQVVSPHPRAGSVASIKQEAGVEQSPTDGWIPDTTTCRPSPAGVTFPHQPDHGYLQNVQNGESCYNK